MNPHPRHFLRSEEGIAFVFLAVFYAMALWAVPASGQTLPATTRPIVLPGTPTYPIDRAVFVSPTGSDTLGDGSVAKPFATFGKGENAITQLRWQRPTRSNDAVLMQVGVYAAQWPLGSTNDNLVIGAYGQSSPAQRATIVCAQSGFQLNGRTGVHFIGIEMQAANRNPASPTWTNREGGDGFTFINGCSEISLDGCAAWHFRNGVDFLGRGGSTIRVWNCNLSFNYAFVPPPNPVNKAFGFYGEGLVADLRYNVIAFNGWCPGKDNFNDPATRQSYIQSHGAYLNQSYSPGLCLSTGNFYVANAATGIQMRPGGVITGDVFAVNGVAADCFTDGAVGWIIGNAVLGSREQGPWNNAGGSLLGQSGEQVIGGNVYLRGNPTPDQPVRLQATNYPATQPSLLNSAASLSGNFGIHPNTGVNVMSPRTIQTTAGNAFVPPVGSVPDLLDYTGQPSMQAWVAWAKDNPDKVNAADCITWATGVAKKLMQPSVPIQPAPIPAPFDAEVNVKLTVDPATQKVTVKGQ